jgi:ribonuclease VapC
VIVDSSAIVAILLRDRGWDALVTKLGQDPAPAVGAPTLAETGIVLTATLGRNARALLSRFLQEAGLIVVPFDDAHWAVALDAYVRFGKGRHPSALNFGDCLTYATAKLAGQPLLCTGNDFARTDLPLA